MNGSNKTAIVYGCNLNFTIVKKYLTFLIEHKYISFEQNEYTTTQSGKLVYSELKNIIELLTI